MKLPRVAVKYAKVSVTARLADGSLVTDLIGVDIAVLPQRSTPSQSTVWTSSAWAPGLVVSGVATVLLAGPSVSSLPGGAVLIPEPGADLWVRVSDNPEIDAAFIDHIDLV